MVRAFTEPAFSSSATAIGEMTETPTWFLMPWMTEAVLPNSATTFKARGVCPTLARLFWSYFRVPEPLSLIINGSSNSCSSLMWVFEAHL